MTQNNLNPSIALPQGTTTVSISNQSNLENFDNFGLHKKLLKGIYRYGWESPSPIQELVIPAFTKTNEDTSKKSKRDIIAQSQSGTGKTGAFLIATIQNLKLDEIGTQAIILSPTRELATQTYTVCNRLSECITQTSQQPLSQLFIGGNYRRDDVNKFKKDIKIVIGTPGRIIDMIKSLSLQTQTIKMLILDEADDLLSQGFAEQIHEIFLLLPKNVQVGLFSATMPNEVLLLTNKFMNEPIRFLKEREELSLKGIKQYQVLVTSDDSPSDDVKLEILIDLYGSMEIAQAVIFCNMKKKVEMLASKLKSKDFSCITMHSEMTKHERERIMNLFRKGESRILIATDVMARGIDIHHVSMVVNFDIPTNKENFLHRSGRAGRYGRKGLTINLVCEREVELIKSIEEYYAVEIESLPNNFANYLNS